MPRVTSTAVDLTDYVSSRWDEYPTTTATTTTTANYTINIDDVNNYITYRDFTPSWSTWTTVTSDRVSPYMSDYIPRYDIDISFDSFKKWFDKKTRHKRCCRI